MKASSATKIAQISQLAANAASRQSLDEASSSITIPGENTVALYVGWAHGTGEPIGTYVFKFTIHGTVNGTAVVLTASSPPIQMSA